MAIQGIYSDSAHATSAEKLLSQDGNSSHEETNSLADVSLHDEEALTALRKPRKITTYLRVIWHLIIYGLAIWGVYSLMFKAIPGHSHSHGEVQAHGEPQEHTTLQRIHPDESVSHAVIGVEQSTDDHQEHVHNDQQEQWTDKGGKKKENDNNLPAHHHHEDTKENVDHTAHQKAPEHAHEEDHSAHKQEEEQHHHESKQPEDHSKHEQQSKHHHEDSGKDQADSEHRHEEEVPEKQTEKEGPSEHLHHVVEEIPPATEDVPW